MREKKKEDVKDDVKGHALCPVEEKWINQQTQ